MRPPSEKPLIWLGSTKQDLLSLPTRHRNTKNRHDDHTAAFEGHSHCRPGYQAMKKRIIQGIEVEAGSSNVFADLNLPNADKLKIKSGLTIEIIKAIRERGLTQAAAAQCMGFTQPKVSCLLRGEFSNFSERKLMDCLNRLGYDIEIPVRETANPQGHLMLTHT
jgi:predicted XRE-type DNA-binding protein